MGAIRAGTVGYSYRDWAGVFYPQGSPPRRQFNTYSQNFDVCELTQFTHQMPDFERMTHFAAQIKTDLKLFVRIHNTFTHCADIGLALTIARHFRKAMEPLAGAGKLAGLVAPFPYAFKDTQDTREYVQQLASSLDFDGLPLQLDFRHPSWATENAFQWMRQCGLGFVCVDEPQLPGLVPPSVVATASQVMVRLHGRNREGWWSGNPTTRFDYLYSDEELQELALRYAPLITGSGGGGAAVSFLFQNHWQAQSVRNAIQWKKLVSGDAVPASVSPASPISDDAVVDEDQLRPPTSLPFSEVKSRVSQALSGIQGSLDLPLRSK